ncbi:LOW QUALITY PROTEIN: ficolin-3 [Hipposideros larvatus]
MDGGLASCPSTSLAPYKLVPSLRGTSKLGLLWIPLALLLLLLREPACLRIQDHPSCPGSPGEKGAPGPQGQLGPPGKMGPKGESLVSHRSCQELLSQGITLSGQNHQCLPAGRALPVFCDMDTPGGGGLVFQRQDGSVDFFHSWSSYRAGFGSQESKFWPGNENLHQLTLGTWELQIELEDFNGNRTFHLHGEADHYQLVQGKFSGEVNDTLSYHNGKSFTTYDNDHDISRSNCVVTVHGAWWYGSCYQSNLNGCYAMYQTTAHKYGIDWV